MYRIRLPRTQPADAGHPAVANRLLGDIEKPEFTGRGCSFRLASPGVKMHRLCFVIAKKWGKHPACQLDFRQQSQAGSLRHLIGAPTQRSLVLIEIYLNQIAHQLWFGSAPIDDGCDFAVEVRSPEISSSLFRESNYSANRNRSFYGPVLLAYIP
jgi:hypothetical protein